MGRPDRRVMMFEGAGLLRESYRPEAPNAGIRA